MSTNHRPIIPKFKIIFLGNQGTGKTSLIQRFVSDTYEEIYQPTIGIDFLSKAVHIGNKSIKLHLWDTAGDEKFRSLIPAYIKDSALAIIMFDITGTYNNKRRNAILFRY